MAGVSHPLETKGWWMFPRVVGDYVATFVTFRCEAQSGTSLTPLMSLHRWQQAAGSSQLNVECGVRMVEWPLGGGRGRVVTNP